MPDGLGETKDVDTEAGTASPSLSTTPETPTETTDSNANANASEPSMVAATDSATPAESVSLKLGKDSPLADADLKGLTEFATENNLDQKTADAMLQYNEKMVGDFAVRAQAHADKQIEGWIDTASKDEEVGGAKFDESKQLAYKVNQRFGTPELRAFLDQGAGNHPEIFRLFVRIGRAMQDDTRESGAPAIPKKEVPLSQKLYGGSTG